jgi:hypothetical protein
MGRLLFAVFRDSNPIFRPDDGSSKRFWHYLIQLSFYCVPKTPNHSRFTLKMATAMFAETLDNFQHSMRLIPKSWSCFGLLNSSCKNLRLENETGHMPSLLSKIRSNFCDNFSVSRVVVYLELIALASSPRPRLKECDCMCWIAANLFIDWTTIPDPFLGEK